MMKKNVIFLMVLVFTLLLMVNGIDLKAYQYLIDCDCVNIESSLDPKSFAISNGNTVNTETVFSSSQPYVIVDLDKFNISSSKLYYGSFRTYVAIVQFDIEAQNDSVYQEVCFYNRFTSGDKMLTKKYLGKPKGKKVSDSKIKCEFYGEISKNSFTTNEFCIGFSSTGGTWKISDFKVQLAFSCSKPKLDRIVNVENGVYIG